MIFRKLLRRLLVSIFFFFSCQIPSPEIPVTTDNEVVVDKIKQDSILNATMKKASKYGLFSQGRQAVLSEGLVQDSTIAYLWQQKAMPLFKQRKYELGMEFIDKAVKYNRAEYQDYRAFIKCVFAKTYRDAIADFEDCIRRFGNNYVQDHSYNFYIAISYLQLNEFEKAEKILAKEIASVEEKQGADWVHHLDLFYHGIAIYEQARYEEAIDIFDKALAVYPQFSDVQQYKGVSLLRLDKKEEAQELFDVALANAKKGYTINEDNEIYELYPYQVRWELYFD